MHVVGCSAVDSMYSTVTITVVLSLSLSLFSIAIFFLYNLFLFFFFQAEDGIRDLTVTGVQTCALPISEVCFHRGADVGGHTGVDRPSAIFILVLENVARGFLEALSVASTEKRVEHDVVGFKCGVSFELSAPVAFFMLLGEEVIARAANSRRDPAA